MEETNKLFTSLWEKITGPDLWLDIAGGLLQIVFIALLAMIVVRISRNLINSLFKDSQKRQRPMRISERRENTLIKLTQSVISYVVYFIAFIMILKVVHIEIGPLLAGAGVAGLAIGFGAQNLVRDIISGFFIVFEDQFSVGDYVLVAGVEGTVEEIGLRTTKVLSFTGEMNVLPNGDITQVTNYSIRNGLSLVEINIPYESDVSKAESVIEEVATTLPQEYDYLVGKPEIQGITELNVSHYVIRIIAETEPTMQWAGERMIRRVMQDRLYKSGIEIPSPRLVVYSSEEKQQLLKRGYERDQ
ncbi:small conductance mechanosensitive channel [Virgibacillus halotolerans]|uniref:mechanosensitive ion channel family protein n=1 Tax=Virgibacillus halotolerans TaxID=1071053 RepID=UPI0019617368|nr:mechanosensitive ion channel family protein [Virgibacillus halotolerans]MBM7601373.1 small conductance mechanosensitive channel [Virgibacillus halotolerans]